MFLTYRKAFKQCAIGMCEKHHNSLFMVQVLFLLAPMLYIMGATMHLPGSWPFFVLRSVALTILSWPLFLALYVDGAWLLSKLVNSSQKPDRFGLSTISIFFCQRLIDFLFSLPLNVHNNDHRLWDEGATEGLCEWRSLSKLIGLVIVVLCWPILFVYFGIAIIFDNTITRLLIAIIRDIEEAWEPIPCRQPITMFFERYGNI